MNENALLNLNLDGEAAKVFIDANEKGITPKFEIITRADDALEVLGHHEKRYFTKKVAVASIFEFVSKRTFPADPKDNKAIIVYCVHPERTRLDFHEDVNVALTTDLSSGLTINPDFKAFQVNKDVFFTMDELVSLARTKGHCFAFTEDVKLFLGALRNFEVKFEIDVKKSDDRQGNTLDHIKASIQKNKLEIPSTLRLNLPLFTACSKVQLELDIEIQRGKSNQPEFGFYSIDAEILLRNQASEIILAEVNKFRDNFICLETE